MIWYRASTKVSLDSRNALFRERAMPRILQAGFAKSPCHMDWFGRNNLNDFQYSFYRLGDRGELQSLRVEIVRGDDWIKVFLNVHRLENPLMEIGALAELDVLPLSLPPASTTTMRLRCDEDTGIPAFRLLIGKQHKLDRYLTKKGFAASLERLGRLLEHDLANLETSIARWHQLHTPLPLLLQRT